MDKNGRKVFGMSTTVQSELAILDTDMDAAGVDADIQARIRAAAGALRGDAHRFIADFLAAWKKDPETLRTEMRRELPLDGLSARVGDVVAAPLVIADARVARCVYELGASREVAFSGVPSIDLAAIGIDPDLRTKIEAAAEAVGPKGSLAYAAFLDDFVTLWRQEPIKALERLTRVNLTIKAAMSGAGAAVASAGGDMWRVSTRPDGTQVSDLVAGPSFEAKEQARVKIGHAAPADEMDSGFPLSLSERRAFRSGPLTDAERALLHPDAERRRLNRELVTDVDDAAREKFSGAIVYLFGAITKDPEYKRRFAAAQRYCERWGMTVLNPTRHPVPASGPLPVDYYMRHCLIDVEACEVMVPVPSPFLDGSAGAAAERAYGECLKKPILDGFVKEV